MSRKGHNSNPSFSAEALRNIVDRVERLKEEKKAIEEDLKQVYGECDAFGFDKKIVKIVVKHRSEDPAALQEREALVDLYKSALGMTPADEEPDAEAPGESVNDGDDASTHAGAGKADEALPEPSCKPGEPTAVASEVTGEACAPSPIEDPAAEGYSAPSPSTAADQAAGGSVASPPAADPYDAGEIPEFLRRTK